MRFIHRIESHVWGPHGASVVSFCGVTGRVPATDMTAVAGQATCKACEEKLEKVSRAEWAAVKP